jgi:hypothetical protein
LAFTCLHGYHTDDHALPNSSFQTAPANLPRVRANVCLDRMLLYRPPNAVQYNSLLLRKILLPNLHDAGNINEADCSTDVMMTLRSTVTVLSLLLCYTGTVILIEIIKLIIAFVKQIFLIIGSFVVITNPQIHL